MNSRFKYLLMPLLVGAVTYSCDQKDLEEVNPAGSLNAENTDLATTANLILNEGFEGSSAFSDAKHQAGASHAFKIVSSPVFEGSKSGRIELRDSDPEASNGTRAEFLMPESSAGKERWYSFKAYYPSSGFKKDSNNDILNQWHQGSGTGSPSTTFRVRNDRFFMKIGKSKETREDFDLGVQTKDTWHEFVFHIVHSNGSDGLVEVWHNGEKVLTHKGGNMYDADLPRWKVGIYKDDWNGSETTDTKERIFYLDQVRMGTEKASFAEMSTWGTPPAEEDAPSDSDSGSSDQLAPQPSTGSEITGFTLIDSHTEKGVLSITDGSTISLSSLDNTKLNVQANTASSFSGTVKFELSGAQSRTYSDSKAPFALHGDDGSGNFYYGNWYPPATGTYTLKATPYSESGAAGTPVTINFTIQK